MPTRTRTEARSTKVRVGDVIINEYFAVHRAAGFSPGEFRNWARDRRNQIDFTDIELDDALTRLVKKGKLVVRIANFDRILLFPKYP